jgi:ABC-type sugar transport system substrate-binding protein
MSQAAADYIATTNLKGKVAVGGFGGQATFVNEIKAGKAYATVPFPVVDDGARAMNRIAQCIRGDKSTVFDSSTSQPALQPLKSAGYVLTAQNITSYKPQY